jgi:IclR family mhp operon transcriptional activator
MERQAKSAQTVHALERGLAVLAAVNDLAPANLSRLVEATGLPKATVVRALHTLRATGHVELAENVGYRLLPKMRELCTSLDRESAPIQAVRRLLNDFASVVKWPADFMAREGATMIIKVSNRDSAPITLKRFEHIRFPLLHSASGIVMLAWSKPAQRERALQTALLQLKPSDRAGVAAAVRGEIAATTKRGYAVRDYDTPIEGTRAIAVPIFSNAGPVAAIALIYLRDAVQQSQVDAFLVPKLRDISARISLHFNAQLPTGMRWSK